MSEANKTSNPIAILLDLEEKGRSGVLRFLRNREKRQLVLAKGALAFAESNIPEEHLARVCFDLDLIERKHFAAVAGLMKQGRGADEALIDLALLDENGLQRAGAEQAALILASVLASDGHEPVFYPTSSPPRRRLIQLNQPPSQVLLAAARRAASCGPVPSHLSRMEGRLRRNPIAGTPLARLPLEAAEAFVYASVPASEAIAADALCALDTGGSVRTRELALRLLMLGLIRLETAAAATAPASEEAAQERLREQVDEMLVRFEVSNHYEILSVRPEAAEDEIKAAYHALAREFHPDRFQSKAYEKDFRERVERVFTFITGAYSVLNDAAARKQYDDTRLKSDSAVDAAIQARATVDLERDKMAEALFAAGRAALAQGDPDKAVSQLRECVWLRPNVANYHHYLGLAQAEIPRLMKEAESHFQKALQLEPAKVESQLALARLYLKVRLPRRAEATLSKLLQWDPNHREAQRLLEEIDGSLGEVVGTSRKGRRSAL